MKEDSRQRTLEDLIPEVLKMLAEHPQEKMESKHLAGLLHSEVEEVNRCLEEMKYLKLVELHTAFGPRYFAQVTASGLANLKARLNPGEDLYLNSAARELENKAISAKNAAYLLSSLSSEIKDKALHNVSSQLIARQNEILEANLLDFSEAQASGMNAALLDRLMLDESRIKAMARDVLAVAALADPVGEMFEVRTLPNDLIIGKKRVPLGVIGAIYESRPNVTIDIASLCLKSGNAVILRGGKETLRSNRVLAGILQSAAYAAGIPEGSVQFVDNTDHVLVKNLLKMNRYIDLIIPRGGAGLIKFVAENASMPVVTGGVGVCHTFVDKTADLNKAVAIVYNAKVQRPTVCNALDTVLVHKDIAREYLPLMARELNLASVELRCDARAQEILKHEAQLKIVAATEEDWGKEFLALTAAIKVVDSLESALEHIQIYGSGHSEAIVTQDYSAGMKFLNRVDAACVYVNASTRFTDGGQFGLGAEVGISTQKFHARGPLGLREITTYKWLIFGDGQVRP
jgi:glutamate-5-semialdehyde dehydrogenase